MKKNPETYQFAPIRIKKRLFIDLAEKTTLK
jgi:hypothetical protein